MPMAANLLRAGVRLQVWNRSTPALREAARLGAIVAPSAPELFDRCDVIIAMLADEAALDDALDREHGGLRRLAPGTLLVNAGTVSPTYSVRLAADMERAGGAFVEAPVSGSRRPAEEGRLVTMLAGEPPELDRVQPLFEALSGMVVRCGPIPGALRMKLAVNVFLIATVTGLAESFDFARRQGLDLGLLREVLDAGQMASPISRVKTAKLLAGDLSPQAAIADVLMNSELALAAARTAGARTPLLAAARELYAEAVERGDGALDMIAVLSVRSARAPRAGAR